MSLALNARRAVLMPGLWVRNELWRRAKAVPSLDLRFAESKSLVDATTGQSLVTFTRASSGTYVGSDGLIKTATTNEPRFDHNPTTGESLGLLVEEQRTNLLTYSEDASNAAWTKVRGAISSNAATAPDGATTADLFAEDSSNATHRLFAPSATITAAATITVSIYFKPAGRTQINLLVDDTGGTASFSAYFSSSGVSGNAATGTGVYTSGGVQALLNGWYRASITGSLGGAFTSARTSIFPAVSGVTSYQGDGTSGIYLWGAQLEVGAFPTSYIPTTTATVTRSADVASISGSNFSSWYRQDEGTVFASAQRLTNAADYTRLLSFNAGTAANVWSLYTNANKYDGYKKVGGGADNFLNGPTVGTLLNNHRTASTTNASTIIIASDGLLSAETAVSGMPTVDRLTIGSEYYPAFYNGTIRRLTYWPVRLGNTVLQQITQ